MRRLLLLICSFILVAVGAAWAVNLCSITGAVELPDGSGCANCTITVNSLVPQTVSSQLINPVVISTTTDASGNLSSFNVAQGLAVQVTISTASGTTGTPFTVIIPFLSTVTFSALAMQSNITGGTTLNNILPPTANVAMAGFTFTGMGCPAGSGQPEVESCAIGGTTPAAGIFTNLTGSGSISMTGNQTNGADQINHVVVNNEQNVAAYGAKLDGKLVTGLTTTSGLTTISGSAGAFAAGDVGKDISVYAASTQSGNIFTGTIATVSGDGSTITVATGGTVDATAIGTAVAKVCTDDTTAIQAAINAVGTVSGSTLRAGVVKLPGGATCINTALLVEAKSIDIGGQGWSRASTSTPLGTQIWWMGGSGGTTAMIQVKNSPDVRVHDLALLGNSRAANEPNDIIQITQGGGTGSITSFGTYANLALGAGGFMGDPENGFYPSGASILPTTEHCIDVLSTGTQSDRNIVSNVWCNLGHQGVFFGQPQAVEWTLTHFACANCGTGFNDYIGGGAHTLINYETLNTSLPFAIGQAAYVTAIDHSEQNSVGGTPGNACTLTDVNGSTICRLVDFKGTGGNAAGTLHLIGGAYAVGPGLTTPFVIIGPNSANTGDFRFIGDDFRFARDPAGNATSPFQIDLSTGIGGAGEFQFTCRNCQGLDPLQNITVPASYSDARASVMIDLCPIESGNWNSSTTGGTGSFQGYCMRNFLHQNHVTIDPARIDTMGTINGLASLQTTALVPNNPVAIASASSCTTAGAARYFYKFTYKDALGNESLPSVEFSPTQLQSCAATVSGTNTILIQLYPLPGASEVCFYRSDTGGPDGGGSGAEKFITLTSTGALADGCMPMNFMNQFGGAINKLTDSTASNSGGASVPTKDSTGGIKVAGVATATGGVVNGCKWQVTLASGVGTKNVPCLSAFTNVAYAAGLATATGAVTTPTAVVGNVFCAQTAANSTTVACTSSAAADGRPVFGVGY